MCTTSSGGKSITSSCMDRIRWAERHFYSGQDGQLRGQQVFSFGSSFPIEVQEQSFGTSIVYIWSKGSSFLGHLQTISETFLDS